VVSYATSKDDTRVFESHGFSIAQEANEIEMREAFGLNGTVPKHFSILELPITFERGDWLPNKPARA
jgi:hypothetical protein